MMNEVKFSNYDAFFQNRNSYIEPAFLNESEGL